MKNKRISRVIYGIISIATIGLLAFTTAEAQVPKKINYQGYLKNSSGNPVSGTVQMTFAIYTAASGGTKVWGDEVQQVIVENGVFNVLLGANTPINLPEPKPYWLGMRVGTDPEMTPRTELTSAVYALFVDGITVNNGNVGIGTTTPSHKVTISSSASETTAPMAQMNIYNPTDSPGQVAGIRLHTASGHDVILRTNQGNAWLELTGKDGTWVHRWVSGNYYAKGIVYATEVRITNPVTFPDFVFDTTYQLAPLNEVEQYIKTEKHLPDIPSAQDITTNGLSVSDMQAKLLQKIEELTLHLIDQDKRLTSLQQENEQLKKRISEIETFHPLQE